MVLVPCTTNSTVSESDEAQIKEKKNNEQPSARKKKHKDYSNKSMTRKKSFPIFAFGLAVLNRRERATEQTLTRTTLTPRLSGESVRTQKQEELYHLLRTMQFYVSAISFLCLSWCSSPSSHFGNFSSSLRPPPPFAKSICFII